MAQQRKDPNNAFASALNEVRTFRESVMEHVTRMDVERLVAHIRQHRDDPEVRAFVMREIDYCERAKALLDQYIDAIRKAVRLA